AGRGNFKASWRHTGLREAMQLSATLAACAALLAAFTLLRQVVPDVRIGPAVRVLPYGVILLDLGSSFLLLVGVHTIARILGESRDRRVAAARASRRVPTLLVGAGRAGALVAREIRARPDTGIWLCGFLDDDPNLHGLRVAGLPVLGAMTDLRPVIDGHG